MNDTAAATAPGTGIVRLDLAGTLAFVGVAVAGVVTESAGPAVVAASIVLFALGIAGFLWSFFVAAERSREFEIGVANLYLLTGSTAPPKVKRVMLGALGVQVVASLVVASIGFSGTGPDDVNLLAFGILVPMFGLGLDGVWASRHGAFGPRIVSAPAKRRRDVPPSDHDLEKNAPHG